MTRTRRVVAVLQARTSSSRLPGKVLLPLADTPLAVLAALRASRDGLEVRLATSTDPTDDVLAHTATKHGIAVIRGSLNDVLGRFVQATNDLAPSDVVVRLTADNAFPDSTLISELTDELRRHGLAYLRTDSPYDGLPYGVSVEVMTVTTLREAAASTTNSYDREHVTPWVRNAYGDATFTRYAKPDRWSHLRATIDSFADYQRVSRVFASVDNPVTASWRELCDQLQALPDAPIDRVPAKTVAGQLQSDLILGTVQLGLAYGAANTIGLPTEEQAQRVLATAVAHGITHCDTARAYGLAEERIGRYLDQGDRSLLRVVTKVRPLDELATDAAAAEVAAATEASVFRSLSALGGRAVDTVLLHRAADADKGGGAVWEKLQQLHSEGIIHRLGVSVQSPQEASKALAEPSVHYIQLPFNVLDHRWQAVAEQAAKRDDVTVVARSALLQGLLTGAAPMERWPINAGIDPAALFDTLKNLAAELNRDDVIDLSLAFVRSQPWIDAVVIGAERPEQVRDLCQRFSTPLLTPQETDHIRATLPVAPVELLDPSQWRFSS